MDRVVPTAYGRVRPARRGASFEYLGIPYAAAPVGERRFAVPQRPRRWEGVRDATSYGPTAPQPARQQTVIPEPTYPGDDYLNLNVFTPVDGGEKLPVLFWIHGGGFFAGSSASPWYRGESFARNGIVTVSFNYRLGVEGFLRLEDAPANRGVLDWIFALEWVRENISSFGGDPDNVTVAGQSAGGAAASLLLSVEAARGLFRRALSMSGTPAFASSPEAAADVTASLSSRLSVRPDTVGLSSVGQKVLVDAVDALMGDGSLTRTKPGLALAPYTDGELIPADPVASLGRDPARGVALVVGSTSQEFNAAGGLIPSGQTGEELRRWVEALGVLPDRTGRYLGSQGTSDASQIAGQAVTDAFFRVPLVRVCEARRSAPSPTFVYEFRWRSPVPGIGAVHCIDVPFAFDTLDAAGVREVAGDDPPQELADDVHGALVAFVKGGDPGWPAFEEKSRTSRVFDVPGAVVDDGLREVRDVWGL